MFYALFGDSRQGNVGHGKAALLLSLEQLQRVAWCVYPRKPSARAFLSHICGCGFFTF